MNLVEKFNLPNNLFSFNPYMCFLWLISVYVCWRIWLLILNLRTSFLLFRSYFDYFLIEELRQMAHFVEMDEVLMFSSFEYSPFIVRFYSYQTSQNLACGCKNLTDSRLPYTHPI